MGVRTMTKEDERRRKKAIEIVNSAAQKLSLGFPPYPQNIKEEVARLVEKVIQNVDSDNFDHLPESDRFALSVLASLSLANRTMDNGTMFRD